MSYAPFDDPNAPPPDDEHAPPEFHPGHATPSDYVLRLAQAIDRLASVLGRLEAHQVSPGGAPPQVQSQPPGMSPGPPAAPPGGSSNETQVKRGKKIYAICRQNEWDIADIGQHVTGHAVNANSQKWSEADQVAVLDAFKVWNVG